MYDSRLPPPSTIRFTPKYGRDANATGISVSERPATISAGLPLRLALRKASAMPPCTRLALALVPTASSRWHSAPSML